MLGKSGQHGRTVIGLEPSLVGLKSCSCERENLELFKVWTWRRLASEEMDKKWNYFTIQHMFKYNVM